MVGLLILTLVREGELENQKKSHLMQADKDKARY